MAFINDPGITEDDLKKVMDPPDLNREQEAFLQEVKASTSYEVAQAIYDKELNTVSVTIFWNQADIYAESVQTAETMADLKTAIAQTPARVITTLAVVDLSGETPVLRDPKNVFDAVYEYTSADNRIMPGLLSDYYTDGSWVLAPKGVYTNTEEIGVRLNFNKELSNYSCVPGIIYTVARGDDILLASDVLTLEDNSIRLDFNKDLAGADCFNEDGFLKAGTYTIMVFDEHSEEIGAFKCTVENEDIEKDEISFKDHKNDYYLSELVYEFCDSDLMANSFVYKSGWWDYDGTSIGKSAFGSNTKTLGFSLAVSPDNEAELYYEYYFSEKSSFSGINEAEPLFEGSCKPSLYDDQACYDLDYTAEELKPGFYGLVVYSDHSRKHIVFTAACLVVKETSGDVIG